MRSLRFVRVTLLALLIAAPARAAELVSCFTPGDDCTSMIVREIKAARTELLVQAYSFTSVPIIAAIGRAKERGLDVRVILDRVNERRQYTGAIYLVNHGIDPLIDYQPAIAHNKVIIIDGREVITGSFNFTKAAQDRNAENVLIIRDDPVLAEAYRKNWLLRAGVSRPLKDFRAVGD